LLVVAAAAEDVVAVAAESVGFDVGGVASCSRQGQSPGMELAARVVDDVECSESDWVSGKARRSFVLEVQMLI